ncbi:MAG TPA: Ig-like domain repeat protein [Acidobacteriaceae bacterium]|nr:Ig-like domain repeat protein [Acidobacteriaceae bacterium]
MLLHKRIVLTRTLLQLAVAAALCMAGAGVAAAANSGNAPQLVPYTIETIAGTPQFPSGLTSNSPGYSGDGGPATPSLASPCTPGTSSCATLNSPYGVAVDSVGNVYISDTNNDIIREVNAQTGLIDTIAGVTPKGCTGISCGNHVVGCADGVLANGNPIGGGVKGIAVDAYGNIYFVDSTTATVSVIYRGGARVAAFITLEDPTGVNTSGGVQPGYVYHVGGTINLTNCSGTTGNADNALAFQGAQMKSPSMLTLDSAGNIYIADTGNATVRVINTQATTQTFFQYQVPPGYMRSITNCNAALTTQCPAVTTSTTGTGINGPVNQLVFNSQYKAAVADAYGNVYQYNGTASSTGPPGIYASVAFAGGTPLTNLLTAEAPTLSGYYGTGPGNAPDELPLTYGSAYDFIDNPALPSPALISYYSNVLVTTDHNFDIRPSSSVTDLNGTIWFMDTHYPQLSRIDQYTSDALFVIAGRRPTGAIAGLESQPASLTNPWYCVYGTATIPWTQGPVTYDPHGDGCPAALARMGGTTSSGPFITADGLGQIYFTDSFPVVRELPQGNVFSPTAVGTTVIQPIQIHFDGSASGANPPIIGPQATVGSNIYTTTSFSIASGNGDFTIDTTTPEFALGSLGQSGYGNTSPTTANWGMWSGLPTCYQFGLSSPDTSYDCLVYVAFDPSQPGVRQGQLTVKTANGSVYNFALSGVGTGGQLAIDGGQNTTFASSGTTAANSTSLGTTAGIAVAQSGVVYIADPDNNRILACPAGTVPCSGPTVVTTTPDAGLSKPAGVAVDASGHIYIADTGNNRILKVNPLTGAWRTLGNNVWISGGQPQGSTVPQYAFKAPQGVAVDQWNNVYVADTGNGKVVEIPSNPALGGAVPLFDYTNAPTFSKPVGVAVDANGFVYVADQQNPSGQVVRIPPGGGDLRGPSNNPYSALFISLPQFGGQGISTPNGVAVDGAGNVYISDGTGNAVWVAPAAGPPNGIPYKLNFSGLKAPAGLGLDASGNLYVADSGNKQVLYTDRQNPVVPFGTVPQDLTSPSGVAGTPDGCPVAGSSQPCSGVLTVTNTGNQPVTLTSPFLGAVSDAQFAVTTNCTSPLRPGTACTITPTFMPTSSGAAAINVTVNGTHTMALTANGSSPLANITLTSSAGLTPAAGSSTTITATVTQSHGGGTPTGTVTFTYAIDAGMVNSGQCGSGGTQTVSLASGQAVFTLPNLGQGLVYTVNATYNGDSNSSLTTASPLVITVPGIQETATSPSVSFTYGSPVPTLTGTISPALPSGVTVSFVSDASQFSNVGVYPIKTVFAGPNACAYGFPTVTNSGSGGGAATVTENPAALDVVIPAYTTAYGAPSFNYASGMKITGALGTDQFSATFTPPDSSVLDVNPIAPATNPYPVVATLTGKSAGNYAIHYTNGTDTVTSAPAGFTVSASATSVLPGSQDSSTYLISVSTLVSGGKGIPTGTVTVTDNFVPINTSVFGPPCSPNLTTNCNNVVPPCVNGATSNCTAPVTLPLVAGSASFNLPSSATALGTHNFTFTYSGDPAGTGDGKADFQCAVYGGAATSACPTTATTPVSLIVDNKDFTVTSNTGPISVLPGVTPSGLGLPSAPNQNSAAPETAAISINGVLGFTGTVTLSCTTQNPSYVFCSMTPPSVTVAASGSGATQTAILSVYTPTQLPLGFFGNSSAQLKTSAGRTVLAFLPFGVLAFCLRRRRRLSQVLLVLMVLVGMSAGMSGCGGGNQVDFYTPVPTGPQTVTVTATSSTAGVSRSLVVPININ